MKIFTIVAFLVTIPFIVRGASCPDKNPNSWGEYVDNGCRDCGFREYYARYYGSYDDFFKTLGNPGGHCSFPTSYETSWFRGFGYFYVPDNSCGSTSWGELTAQDCSYPGKRRHYAKLSGVQYSSNKEFCCQAKTDNVFGSIVIRKAAKCEVNFWGTTYGYFDLPDVSCLETSTYNQCPANSRRKRLAFNNRSFALNHTLSRFKRSTKIPTFPHISYTISDQPEIDFKNTDKTELVDSVYEICPTVANWVPCPDPIVATNPIVVGNRDRVNVLIACVRPCNLGTGTNTNDAMRLRARALGEDNVVQIGTRIRVSDDAGHILGRQLGGVGTEARNIFPQNLRCNRGRTDGVPGQNRGWTEVETYIRRLLNGYGRNNRQPVATVLFELLYTNAETRPLAIQAEVIFERNQRGFVMGNPSNTDA